MTEVAMLHRLAFNTALPWLADRHTPEEDDWFFRHRVYPMCAIWGAADAGGLIGFIAFRRGWIDQLYVHPDRQGRGVGSALLGVAQQHFAYLQLWTFQRNTPARRFYERRGFVLVEMTEGTDNEEREPDVRYEWRRPAGGHQPPAGAARIRCA